jgi:hypothetical protein
MTILLADISTKDPYFQWVMIALALITIFYAVIRPGLKKKKDPLEKPPAYGKLSSERTVERQMQNLLVELSEMTRQITAQLDTRAQKLQLLIEEADKRIAELQRTPKQPIPARSGEAWSAPAPPNIPSEPVDESHQKVYDLADHGHSAGEIARELNQPRGEVELILALRPKAGV